MGLLTLTYVPNYFDMRPLYLAILALIPVSGASGSTPATPSTAPSPEPRRPSFSRLASTFRTRSASTPSNRARPVPCRSSFAPSTRPTSSPLFPKTHRLCRLPCPGRTRSRRPLPEIGRLSGRRLGGPLRRLDRRRAFLAPAPIVAAAASPHGRHPPAAVQWLADRLATEPGLGLIQTVPRVLTGATLWQRLQSFASEVYGPNLGRGSTFWAGAEGQLSWPQHPCPDPGLRCLRRTAASARSRPTRHAAETLLGLGLLALAAQGHLTPWLLPVALSLALTPVLSWRMQRDACAAWLLRPLNGHGQMPSPLRDAAKVGSSRRVGFADL